MENVWSIAGLWPGFGSNGYAAYMPKHLLPSLKRDKRARAPVGAAEEAE
jgi:hypothetical protein